MDHRAPKLDWVEVRNVYVGQGLLSNEKFENLVESAVRIHALGLVGASWSITHQVLSEHRNIPLALHYEALRRGYGFAKPGVLALHTQAIDCGLLPARSLNQTRFFSPPKQGPKFGQLLVQLGLAESQTVERCVEVQRVLLERVGSRVALGSIALASSTLSYPDFYQVLAIQAGVPYQDLDSSASLAFDTIGEQLSKRDLDY